MYKIESLAEINAKPKVGTVVSTFAGMGGSSLGYKMAGLDVKASVEFIPEAANTYRTNHPSTNVLERNVREISGKDILDAIGMGVGDIDIFDGSPPCSSFSMAGKREKGWGEEKKYSDTATQRTDDLFDEYARLVYELMPKTFVAENVKGLVQGSAKDYLDNILGKLGKEYNVAYRVMNAAHYGVPQSRERVILIGVRKDLNIMPSYPVGDAKNQVSVQEAWEGLEQDEEQRAWLLEKMPTYSIYKQLVEIEHPGQNHQKRFSLARNYWHRPSLTITQTTGSLGAAGVCHPFEHRKMTVPEIRRLSSVPDDFVLTGKYEQQVERLGRLVPPLLMRAVAENIRDNILGLGDKKERKAIPNQMRLF